MIDVNDFRKYTETAKVSKAPLHSVPEHPVEQVEVPDVNLTGDDKFDKLIRSMQVESEQADHIASQVMLQAMAAIAENDIRKMQLIFAFQKGKVEAYKAAAQIPARILAEARLIS